MRARTYLELGRVSNLPTVWTNVLAGAVLAGGPVAPRALAAPLAAGTVMYVGGMFLNDAFDREIDRRERPERAIPSGRVSAGEVFGVGFGLMALGWLLLLLQVAWLGYGGPRALLAGAALAGAIVLYNSWHKGNPIGPVLMGLCRSLLYLTAGLSVAERPTNALAAGAAVMLCYLIGLTYVAKQENLAHVQNMWPLAFLAAPFLYAWARIENASTVALGFISEIWVLLALRLIVRRISIGRAVVSLIAGISLVDALLIARAGAEPLAWIAASGVVLTVLLQRYVRGT
jgi:4-hydroxybenzoate polyprenyltransferase